MISLEDKVNELDNIIKNIGEPLEGNCFYRHRSDFVERKGLEHHRHDIMFLSQDRQRYLEIGVNGGHSCLLVKHANPNIEITGVDICRHSYVEPCCNHLGIRLLKGDSKKVLPTLIENGEIFDYIHIDGGHGLATVKKDILNCKQLANQDTLVLIDDTSFSNINNLCNIYIEQGILIDISANYQLDTRKHRLFKYLY